MRRRHAYLLLFGAPALLAALLVGAIVLVFALAIFWIFIFGDNTWPDYSYYLLAALFIGAAGTTFAVLLYHAYEAGKRQEETTSTNRAHIALAIASTLALLIVPALYVWHSSQADQTPEGACAFYCKNRGFAASGMPPRNSGDKTCTCYGPKGEAGATFPLPEDPRLKK
ncbi:MAG: hypothetical protein ACM30H_02945 [Clostridia bacterium]